MTATDHRRAELRDFLRTRRARLSPADVGMPPGMRRRTPGLRREEVAVLAGVGVSWYTWLEQGRDITVSAQVIDAIARALRLGDTERRHLHLLAGLAEPAPRAGASRPVPDELRRVLDGWLPRPAYVIDRYWNFLAVNRAAELVFGFGADDHNCLVTFFTNVAYQATVREWADVSVTMAAMFRAESARHPGDGHFAEIAADLASVSEEFAEVWARHEVADIGPGVKAILHPRVGDLVFENVTLPLPDRPGERLVLHSARPGTGTEERLATLLAGVTV
ncbi:helix-turn-helix transcriptional regulator [Phytomonospora sp. NPDC050363]|uniref:helix-turn-helix transcriptional regulator n=1 Tax=Phytomonospora sp. NPDC050363 TaxID=3155642 RepID=UPI0033CAACAC